MIERTNRDAFLLSEGNKIILGVAATNNTQVEEIKSRRRTSWLCRIRGEAVVKLYGKGFSYDYIRYLIGDRSRWAVMRYLKKYGSATTHCQYIKAKRERQKVWADHIAAQNRALSYTVGVEA